jgi:hypothetical protein
MAAFRWVSGVDLSFGWEIQEKPVEDVEALLKETSAHAVAAAK